MNSKLSLILFLCVCLIAYVSARKCYQCVGKDACKTPQTMDCPAGVDYCITETIEKWPYVVKYCSEDDKGNPINLDGCTDVVDPNYGKITACGCNSKDLCNDQAV